MAIQQNFPNLKPTLNLDFANTKALDPRITYTRASSGRFYDGKTVAKAEENLVRHSQEFDNAVWSTSRVTITANTENAPDGTATAETITEDATNNTRSISQARTFGTGAFSVSLFVKAGTAQYCSLSLVDGAGTSYFVATYDVTGGTVTQTGAAGSGWSHSSSSITSVGDGWYRIVVTGVAGSVAGFLVFSLANTATPTYAAFGRESYLGSGRTLFIWGAQVEARDTVTAYTPTTTQPITNYIPVLQVAGNNVPRFDHNPVTSESLGLLIEEQRTNLLLRSEEFNDAYWTKEDLLISTNAIVAPDGTLTADKLIPNTNLAAHRLYRSGFGLGTNSHSFYAKAGEYTKIVIGDAGGLARLSVNLTDGSVVEQNNVSSYSINSVGNSWYRISITFAGNAGFYGIAVVSNSYTGGAVTSGGNAFTGDGYSGIYIWGAQLEAGAFPTSYIPTVASQVTRSADAASMTGANFSSWYRADEGSVYWEASTFGATGTTKRVGSVSDGTNNNRVEFVYTTVNNVQPLISSNGSIQFNPILGVSSGSFQKMAAAYKFNDVVATLDAQTPTTGSTSSLPQNVDRLVIGAGTNGTADPLCGSIKKFAFHPLRLSDTELVALTS